MKTQFLLIGVAGILVFGQPAHAAAPEVESYLAAVNAKAQARLAAAGVPAGQPIQITARVAGDGRLHNARVAQSTGSLETDQKVREALKSLQAPTPPAVMAGRVVKLTLGAAAEQHAGLP